MAEINNKIYLGLSVMDQSLVKFMKEGMNALIINASI